jgi:hypothetical protein
MVLEPDIPFSIEPRDVHYPPRSLRQGATKPTRRVDLGQPFGSRRRHVKSRTISRFLARSGWARGHAWLPVIRNGRTLETGSTPSTIPRTRSDQASSAVRMPSNSLAWL